ncbi:hypothetical protein L6164_016887 [Bauhinia variegata]|uniref:Uncharacterized protein n=1 Tax=Bauhinia variegata TaxID=167791 RepID=A0ACB9NB83_BAUVA|nr:hypothetical protein L6164_016887 [Bauhinia variegata]
MAFNKDIMLSLCLLAFLSSFVSIAETVSPVLDVSSLNRTSFPEGFIFGTASSAYQSEGAANTDGRGPSIWDTYTHQYPEKINDRSNADVAVDGYHRYKEDVAIQKDMNLDAYRFSISWSRILPEGKLCGGVNQEGIKYYNNLINELLANGLQPFVTLFHFDVPHALEDEYGGFLSPQIAADFQEYADICFKEFGDRVKYWITLNEPWTVSQGGYASGSMAPGRCSDWMNLNCTGGDTGTEPYLASHNQLLAHAAAVRLYRIKYKASQKGLIGITLNSNWYVPVSDKKPDQDAAQRALDFNYGWFMQPLTTGEYPESMQSLVGTRLPKFTQEQSDLVRGSYDFLGLNYYTAQYAADTAKPSNAKPSFFTDSLANLTFENAGKPIGPRAASFWLYIYPRGIYELLVYTKRTYNNPLIYITENGMDEINDPTLPLEKALTDTKRVEFYQQHLYYVNNAIKDGVNVKGYFAWSLLDTFEWPSGYTVRFGMNFVDFKNSLTRYPKLSAKWFKNFLNKC